MDDNDAAFAVWLTKRLQRPLPPASVRRRFLEQERKATVAWLRTLPDKPLTLLSEYHDNEAGNLTAHKLADFLQQGKLVAGLMFKPHGLPIFAFVVQQPSGGFFLFDNIGLRNGMGLGSDMTDFYARRFQSRGAMGAHWQRLQGSAQMLGWQPFWPYEQERFFRRNYPRGRPVHVGLGLR